MLKSVLPKYIEPFKSADQMRALEGVVQLADLPRISEFTLSSEGDVQASLKFGLDEEGIRHVQGHLSTSVKVVCQRCLDEMDLAIESDFQLAMVWSDDAAANVPKRYEPWVIEKDEASLYELLEDEILLEIPVHATHPNEDCVIQTEFGVVENEPEETDDEQKENPFAMLAQLKSNK